MSNRQVMRFFADICRVDEEQRMVYGYLATTGQASDGYTLSIDAIRAAFAEWWQWGNIREMHQPVAVGVVQEGTEVVDDVGAYGGVKVVDDAAWEKVKAKVYKAFSVRFVITAVDALNKKLVTAFKVIEASLVDIPADGQCAFTEFRSGDAFTVFRSADFIAEEPATMTKPAAAPTAPQPTTEAAPAASAESDVSRTEGGDPKKGEGDPPQDPPAEEPPPAAAPEADPLSEAARAQFSTAFDALNRIEQARGLAPVEGDVSRSMWTVKDLASLLSDLYYLINNNAWEAAIEGEGSGVSDKLKTALKTLAEAFKELSAQEAEQLVSKAGVTASRALEYALARGGDAPLTDEEHAAVQRAIDGFVQRGFKLPTPAPASNGAEAEEVKRLNEQVATLSAANGAYEARLGDIVERLNKIAAQPAPPKTAASGAVRPVDKTEDAPGAGDVQRTGEPQLTADDVQRALAAMPEEERAATLMKASLRIPSARIAQVAGVAPRV